MSKILTFLILLGGLVGAYFVVTEHLAEKRVRSNPFVDDVREQITKNKAEAAAITDGSISSQEGRFWRVLFLMNEADRNKYSVVDTVGSATSSTPKGEAKMLADGLLESYNLGKQFGVFTEPKNLLRMEQGLAPVATTGGLEDEKLCVGQRISPVLAPEVAGAFVNFVLVPEAFRDMQGVNVTGFTTDTVKKWSAEKLITMESVEAILEVIQKKDN